MDYIALGTSIRYVNSFHTVMDMIGVPYTVIVLGDPPQ